MKTKSGGLTRKIRRTLWSFEADHPGECELAISGLPDSEATVDCSLIVGRPLVGLVWRLAIVAVPATILLAIGVRGLQEAGTSEAPEVVALERCIEDPGACGDRFEEAEQLCAAGDGLGCEVLGALLAAGVGARPDGEAAVNAWTRACELGRAAGCRSAGEAYLEGRGVSVDDDLGQSLTELGCTQGDAESCATWAERILEGAAPGDEERALELFDRACRNGFGPSCERFDALSGGS